MEKQLLEKIKNDIRVWRKNEQAFCDLAGLVYELKTKGCADISSATLFYRVLNNLEDPEIWSDWIEYKGESLYKLYGRLLDRIYSLEKCYSEVSPESSTYFKKIRSKNIGKYLFDSRIVDKNRKLIHWYDAPYNVVTLLKDNASWIRELLISKIPKETRIHMLDDIIKSDQVSLDSLVADSGYPDSVCPVVCRKIDDEEEEKKESIKKVIELFSDWKKVTFRGKDDAYNMMKNMPVNNLAFLQRNGIVDFVKEVTYSSEYGKVGVPVQIFRRNPQNLPALIEFYGFESYQGLEKIIKQNTDKLLIHDLVEYSCHDLCEFMKSKDFKISDENVTELILALSGRKKDVCDWEMNLICDAIETKAQTPKEYRKFKQYTTQIRDCLNPEKLQRQRQEFVIRLRNMNESLQEQVPGKMKIKNIKFQIENK